MESVNKHVLAVTQPSWLQKRCRALVLKVMESLEGVALTLHEGADKKTFGDAGASLHAHMTIMDWQSYVRIIRGGSIGAAEAYIDGQWTSPDLTKLIRVFARAQAQLDKVEQSQSWFSKLGAKIFHRLNRNTQSKAKQNILAHYDLGNELYSRFLDSNMVYSSAVYDHPEQSLEQAQLNKFEHICQQLELNEQDHLVEIGTGWGGLAIYAAQQYGCTVTTTTISEQQYLYAKARVEQLGLSDKITLLKQDYRELQGQFDKLVSVEMIEAVGKEYYSVFFNKCSSLLKPNGKLLIQAITIADQRFEYYANNVDFIQRYIFPGGCLPSVSKMCEHLAKDTDMVPLQLKDIGIDYALTLREWRHRFDNNWLEIQNHGFDDRFKRLWHYYLCYCEGGFLERKVSTVHLVARKPDYSTDQYL